MILLPLPSHSLRLSFTKASSSQAAQICCISAKVFCYFSINTTNKQLITRRSTAANSNGEVKKGPLVPLCATSSGYFVNRSIRLSNYFNKGVYVISSQLLKCGNCMFYLRNPVARKKCWHCLSLQTTDMLKLHISLCDSFVFL